MLHRVVVARRASPLSRTVRGHAAVGALAALFVYVHVGCAAAALGDPSVVRAGNLAILPALLAAFLVLAHVGVGIRLRSPRLRERVRLRRTHAIVACTILVAGFAHVLALQ